VLDTLKSIRGKASNLDSVSKLQVQDWIKSLARCRADLERAPLSRGDHEPLRQLWVDVSKMGQEMSDRARKSAHGEELAGALYSFTQALSRRMQDAGKAEPGAGSAGDSGAVKKEVRRLEEQLDRGNAGITDELKRLAARIQTLENAPPSSLGKLVEDEFRALCESRADELERQLAGVQRSAAAPRVIPPVVAKAMQVADAALRVSEEALKARGLDPGVKAQLTNLGTLASTLQAMCPVSADQSKPPSVAGLRSLPDRAEARWQAEIVARGGSIINGITAYWSEVNRLLQAESARIEQYLGGAAPDSGAQEAAIGDWLGSRLLPLLDQASGALQENGPARREARIGNASNLLAAMDDLHRACEAVMKGTGLEPRMARTGDIQRPEAGVKIEHVSGGAAPDAILEVRQLGWSWEGRLLRELHVVVQEEGGSSAAPVTTVAAIPDESATGPRSEDAGPRVKRL
jgi:molecular chaperone GrpE (heat shock protein)